MDRETSGEPESGSASSATDAVCPDCPQSWPAQCSVNYDSRNITCSVDLSSCRPFIPCDQNELCFAHFYRMSDTNWTFSGVCFPKEEGHKRKENCELRSRSDLPFPPRSGLECLCTKCSNLDQEVTYIDPFPPKPLNPEETSSSVAGSSLPATVKSSLVTPSPSPNTRAGSSVATGYVAAGVALGFLLVLVVVAIISVSLLYRWRKKKKQSQSQPRSSRHTRRPGFPDAVDEEPPFQLGHLVSRGRYGYVYRTEYEGELVAVKVFAYQNRLSWENERTLFGMQSTKHRNVIDYIVGGMWGSGYQLQMFIVTPFFPLGSLNRFLARNTVSWEQACRVIHSVSSGLAHLHSESYISSGGVSVEKYAVAHRDIKSANVLVRGENGDCVISDLGFAMILDPTRDEKDMANTGQVGTYRYMAPEVLDARISLQDIQAFKQIDIYSLSLVMWEVAWRCNVQQEESLREYLMAYEDTVGQRPGIDTMRDLVCTQKIRPRILLAWRNHPGLSSLVNTIEECWDEDPEARLSASNIILRLKELVDGGPAALASDHTPLHTFPLPPVVPSNEQFRVSEALESTTDTIETTDSRPPPYDSRWSYAAGGGGGQAGDSGSGEESSISVEFNFEETTV